SFQLDAWPVGSALADAEFRSGQADVARNRLRRIAADAQAASALLAARVARETASRLGVEIEAARERPAEGVPSTPVAPGERMVSILFADVRGYSRLAGETAPAELADRIASLQRWATHEVERRHGSGWLEAQRMQAERVEWALKGFDSPVVAFKVTTGVLAAAPG